MSWVDAIAVCEAQQGAPVVARMAKLFIDSSKIQLQTIDTALAQNSIATARAAAHDLAANAKSMCFMQLHQVAQDFETACAKNDLTSIARLHKDLGPLVNICVLQARVRYKLA